MPLWNSDRIAPWQFANTTIRRETDVNDNKERDMSLQSFFAMVTSLGFWITAFRFLRPDFDLHGVDFGPAILLLLLFEAAWAYVNWIGVRGCKRMAAGRHYNGASTVLFLFFALTVLFQVTFFFQAIFNVASTFGG